MKSPTKINIILLGKASCKGKIFFDALANLDLPHSLITLRTIDNVPPYLNGLDQDSSNVLVLYVSKKSDIYLDNIRSIRKFSKYKNLSILMYDPAAAMDVEEAFAAGANIYMRKPADTNLIKKKLKHLFSINCQYARGNLDNETFFLAI